MQKEPEIIGDPVQTASFGDKPSDIPGHVWLTRPNPSAGNCEADWYWCLYKLAPKDQFGPQSTKRSNQFYQ